MSGACLLRGNPWGGKCTKITNQSQTFESNAKIWCPPSLLTSNSSMSLAWGTQLDQSPILKDVNHCGSTNHLSPKM